MKKKKIVSSIASLGVSSCKCGALDKLPTTVQTVETQVD